MKIETIDVRFLDIPHSIAAFLIEGSNGHVLVECGPHSVFPTVQQALLQRGVDIHDLAAVFLSHIHFDHAGAAWAFAAAGVDVYVHPVGLPHLAAPEKLYNSARQIYGDQMDRLWGRMEPIPAERLHAAADGALIEKAGLRLRAWHTPGHASHHIAWELGPDTEEHGTVLFTGDVAGVRISHDSPVMPPCPPPDINIEEWLLSIQRLRDLPAQRLFLTHFGEFADKAMHLQELETRLLDWAEWMRPYALEQTAIEQIVPLFTAYVRQQLSDAGVNEAGLAKYEAANPAFMSVAGLMRYWKKKGLNPA